MLMLWSAIAPVLTRWVRPLLRLLLAVTLAIVVFTGLTPAATAGLTDDHFDGNIFPLYAGNGSLIPPRLTLAQALKRDKPTLLVLYVDDSKDCKDYASVLSRVDAFYGRAADLVFLSVDSLPVKDHYDPTEPGYYFKGFVPQTVLFDQSGQVVLDEVGVTPFEKLDDVFRQMFDLLPRSESVELKRRQINEVNTELVPE